jgi:integrase
MEQNPVIEDFLQWKTSMRDISSLRERNYRSNLQQFLAILGKDILTCSTEDILSCFKKIRESKRYKPNYKRLLISVGKNFSQWAGKTNKKIDLAEIAAVRLPEPQWKTKRPEDMLTIEEVSTVIKAARSARDKALISMLYDGSNRPIEILRLRWSDLIADEYGYYFVTDAKTRKERHIRLTNQSIPYLDQWKAQHPDPSPDQYVFCTINATEKGIRPMSIDNLQRMIKLLKKWTGIKKLKASIFRPTKITHDVASGVELPYIMKKNWGSLRTKMIDVYTNLDAGYMDEVALRNAGMERRTGFKEKKIYKLEPPVCPVCHKVNLLGSKYCAECITPLTEEAQQSLEVKTQAIEQNPRYEPDIEKLVSRMVEEKLKKMQVA